MKLYLAIFTMFVTPLVQAAKCSKHVNEVLSDPYKVRISSPKNVSTKEYRTRYAALVKNAEEAGFKIPNNNVQIKVKAEGTVDSYHGVNLTRLEVLLPPNTQSGKNAQRLINSNHLKYTLSQLDHEVGVVIFKLSLANNSKIFKNVLKYEKEYSEFSLHKKTLLDGIDGVESENIKARYIEEIEQADQILHEYRQYFLSYEYTYFKNKFKNLSNLFSDFTSLLQTKDIDTFENHKNFPKFREFLVDHYLSQDYYLQKEGSLELYKALLTSITQTSNQLNTKRQHTNVEISDLLIARVDRLLDRPKEKNQKYIKQKKEEKTPSKTKRKNWKKRKTGSRPQRNH